MKVADALLKTPEFNVLVVSFLLNLAWEYWQVPFFRGMADQPHWEGVKACTQATLGDSAIALAAFWVTAILARSRGWILQPRKPDIAIFISGGIVATIVLEHLATRVLGRWAYDNAMPRLPILGIGLLPLLQWLLTQDERYQIAILNKAGHDQSDIARVMNRKKSTRPIRYSLAVLGWSRLEPQAGAPSVVPDAAQFAAAREQTGCGCAGRASVAQ